MSSAFLPKPLSHHMLMRARGPWFHKKKYSREASGSVWGGERVRKEGRDRGSF